MGTFNKIKEGFKKPQKKLKIQQKKLQIPILTKVQKMKRNTDEKGGSEPMNPEDIAEHEPTAVKRDKNQGTSGDAV